MMSGGSHRRRHPVLLASCLTLLTGCAVNPATGERQLSLISRDQEIQLGRDAAHDVADTIGFVDAPALQGYVERVGGRLAAASERPNLPWQFHVVDDSVPNAFALPGGFIYVTRGLMNLMTSEAQLASVLGHEIGHVTARHIVNQISTQQLAQLGLGLGGVLVPEVRPFQSLIGTGLGLLFLKYSRDDERQADELGFRYMSGRGYDVSQFDDVFRALARVEKDEDGAIPGWLATHPAPEERVEAAEQRAAAAARQNARVGREAYLRHLDGLVYGSDPRDGFFREGVFYHPRLRFQIDFPARWEGSNLTQAVVAVEPQKRAVVQLTLVPGDLQGALSRFTAAPAVRQGRTSRSSVHGLPALVAEFQAQTDGGLVQGLVAFISYRDRTYQVIGYTAAGAYGNYAPEFEQAIRGFAPVTNRSILAVQPKRIDIVELPRRLSVAEFADRYDAAVPATELAVLNHQPGPESILSAGMLVKRVIG